MVLRCRSTLLFGFLAVICLAVNAQRSTYSANMFLNGDYKNTVGSHQQYSVNPASNIFLEHAIISRQAAPFAAPTYLPPKQFITCGSGQQCVRKNVCQSGYYSQKQRPIANCNPENEVCCTYRPPETPRPTTPKAYVQCRRDQDCVSPSDCQNGEIVSTNYIHGGSSNTCFSPNICCSLPSTTLTENGYQLKVPDSRFVYSSEKSLPIYPQSTQKKQPPVQTNPPARPTKPQNEYLPPVTQPSRYTPPATTPAPRYPKQYPQTPQSQYTPSPSKPQQPQRYTPSSPQTPQSYKPQPQQPSQSYKPTSPQPSPNYQPSQPKTPQNLRPTSSQPSQSYLPPQPQPPQRYTPQKPAPQPSQSYLPPQPQTPQRYTPQKPAPQPSRPYRPQPQVPIPVPDRDYLPPSDKDNEVPTESRTVTNRVTVPKPTQPIRGEGFLSPKIVPQSNFDVPSKCASALLCTSEEYCNSIGVISDTPVDLSPAAKAFRVPMTDCTLPNGGNGKCCRDSNYVDPWPVNMAGICGMRNKGTKPTGIQDIDSNFGEIPWQAMILKQSTKSLLCGGSIIGAEHVLTTAECVRGVSDSDIRVKAGEWELGNDSEPLPFQIVGAKYIKIHPTDDMAIIRLDKALQFATHIKPICISDKDPSPSEKCITTGWGKQAIRAHEQGAIMHVTDTTQISRSDCGADQSSVCSKTKHDACQFDSGSALACGGSSVLLKGIFSAENSCGEGQPVRFTKPDIKWINEEFTERNKAIFKRFN